MQRYLITSSLFCFFLFSGCSEKPIAILDYYFPLESIENYQIYEYSNRIYGKEEDVEESSYLRIGKLANDEYYFVSLDHSMVALDSAVMRLENGSILIDKIFLYTDGNYAKCEEQGQVLYPSNVQLNTNYSLKHTFNSININDIDTKAMTKFNMSLSAVTDSTAKVNIETTTVLKSNESESEFQFEEKSTIVNKKGIGLYSESLRGKDYSSYKKLVKIWTANEWEEFVALQTPDIENQTGDY
jgi:hypothetical protein